MKLGRVHNTANGDAASAWLASGRVIDRCVKLAMAEGLRTKSASTSQLAGI